MGQFKNFKYEFNQNVWDQFSESRYQSALENGRVKAELRGYEINEERLQFKAQQNVNVYKPVMLELERTINDTFDTVTIEDIQNTIEIKPKAKSLLNAFLLFTVNNELIKVSNDVIIKLIPKEYKNLVKLLNK